VSCTGLAGHSSHPHQCETERHSSFRPGACASSRNLLRGGGVVFLLTGVGTAASLAARGVSAGITIAAIQISNLAVLLLGTGVAGLGYGPAFTGAYRTVVARAPAGDRAGLIAAVFTLSYLSTGVGGLVAGITTTHYGLHATALVFSAVVTGLAAAAAGTFVTGRGSRAAEPQPTALPHPPPGPGTVPPHVPATHPAIGQEDHGKDRARAPQFLR
jgi:Major Facilitator Superfamily